MPRYAEPNITIPDGVRKAAGVLGLDLIQLSILRTLLAHPDGMTAGALQRELQVSHAIVFRRLRQLEQDGSVVVAHAGGARQGHRLIYRADLARIDAELTRIRDWLTSRSRP